MEEKLETQLKALKAQLEEAVANVYMVRGAIQITEKLLSEAKSSSQKTEDSPA